MAPSPLSRSFVIILMIITSSAVFAKNDFTCKDVDVKSKTVEASEKVTLCFLRDDTYFISENCASLNCKFIDKLKKHKASYSGTERPGASTCRAIGGVTEEVSIPLSKIGIRRCLFPDENASISLNLLESWNGKYFVGPSVPIGI